MREEEVREAESTGKGGREERRIYTGSGGEGKAKEKRICKRRGERERGEFI